MADLGNYTGRVPSGTEKVNGMNITYAKKGANLDLDMSDFLKLMITELTTQGIDESMDTSDMLNQMVQMQMVTALANMTDASIMSYAASLVGKEVTVAKYDENGELQELVGVVQGTGTLGGEQVVIVNDEYYYMSEIMAVGKLPPKKETDKPEDTDKTDQTGGTGSAENSGGVNNQPTEKTDASSTDNPDTSPVQRSLSAQTPYYDGSQGADI